MELLSSSEVTGLSRQRTAWSCCLLQKLLDCHVIHVIIFEHGWSLPCSQEPITCVQSAPSFPIYWGIILALPSYLSFHVLSPVPLVTFRYVDRFAVWVCWPLTPPQTGVPSFFQLSADAYSKFRQVGCNRNDVETILLWRLLPLSLRHNYRAVVIRILLWCIRVHVAVIWNSP
jgi:hypothetical protein